MLENNKIPFETSTIHWCDPSKIGDILSNLPTDGLDYLRQIIDGQLPTAPAIVVSGLELTEVARGKAKMAYSPEILHCNSMRQVHGGVVATLLDSAIGYAVLSTLPFGVGFSTVQLNVNYMRPFHPDTGNGTVASNIVKEGKRIIVATADLHCPSGKLCANATATCLPSS